jgi:hypothetical protein
MNSPLSREYHDGTFRCGDIVVASVRNPLENHLSAGKNRPFLLVDRTGGSWRGMGLTTNSRYASGAPRVAIPYPFAVGLRGPGFLWGDRLTNVSVLDITKAIGRADIALAEAVIDLAQLDEQAAFELRHATDGWAA